MVSGFLKSRPGVRRVIFIGSLLALSGLAYTLLTPQETPPVNITASSSVVVARGRIEPLSRVRAIYGPSEGGVVQKLLVEQGETVQAGQILAYMKSYDIRQAEVLMAERTLSLTTLQRDQTVAGAKASEIAAQRNVLAAKEARRDMLEREWLRRKALFAGGHISQQTLDSAAADRRTAENEVAQARNVLKGQTETRGIDDQVALARIDVEQATLEHAKAQAEHLIIRAPIDGVILSLQSREGEVISQDGLLRMAAIDHLEVVAEVDENQAGHLRNDMPVTLQARFFDHPISGRISHISQEVFRAKRPASDVLTGRDARIVEVNITPASPLPTLLGAEVIVHFDSNGADDAGKATQQ